MKTSARKNANSPSGASLAKRIRLCLAAAMALAFMALFTACWGGDDNSSLDWVNSIFVHNGDVFVAGALDMSVPGGGPYSVAALWKNGRIIYQSDPAGELDGPATQGISVYVADGDAYMAGMAYSLPTSAVLWKNGVAQRLSQLSPQYGFSRANSVFVCEGDVYVVGYEPSRAVLWKNGEAQPLTDGSQWFSPNSVFVSRSDVYIAGNVGNKAAVWKNGETQYLTDGSKIACAESVFVSGGDVYAAGRDGEKAALWKNGEAQYLSGDSQYDYAKSVFVYGGDVYVAGYDNTRALLWKNGAAQYLGNGSARSVFVSNGDVYVAGRGGYDAVVWKNGRMQRLERK